MKGLSQVLVPAERAPASEAGTGLVNLSTKAARDPLIEVDRAASRVRRLARRVDHCARELHFSASSDRRIRYRPVFVTLTYRAGEEWAADHIRSFSRLARDWFRHRGCRLRMVWVAELQQRGAVHYHAVLWVPSRLRLPCPDASGWWSHGMSNLQTARSPIGYLCKYASKGVGEGLRFPRNCRTHGACGLEPAARKVVRWWCAPGWVRDSLHDLGAFGADVRKVAGGWADRVSGLFVASPWRLYLPGNGRVFFYKVEVAK